MFHNSSDRHVLPAILLLTFFVWLVPVAQAQEQTATPTPIATPTQVPSDPSYTNYRGVTIGMSVQEAREKLGKPTSKGTRQDFYVVSTQESAQIFYLSAKVSAVSVDYVGVDSGAPMPMDVFGEEVKPMKSGRVYKLVRYPKAGYWVSYNRTASKSPTVSITMRKIR